MTSKTAENELMAAALLGISQEDASERLNKLVYISAPSQSSMRLAGAVRDNLARTVHISDDPTSCDIEIVLGGESRSNTSLKIYVSLSGHSLNVHHESRADLHIEDVHPLKVEVASCYVASVALAAILGVPEAHQGDLEVDFVKLGLRDEMLLANIHLESSVLLGAGAVGNGFLRALRHLNVSGDLSVIDPKNVRNGNLNRCLFFTEEDEGFPKAAQLAARAQEYFSALNLVPFVGDFAAYTGNTRLVRRVFVAVDTRDGRRKIQGSAPFSVIDASTTEAKEIIVHSHIQPTSGACLACIYKFAPEESSRKKDIAASLGLTLDDIRSDLVDSNAAAKIALARPELASRSLIGTAYETLFKGLCGMDVVRTEGGKQVLAPFAFVSNLAGAMQAIELLRTEAIGNELERKNYFYMSPWNPPNIRARKFRGPDPECYFCSNPAISNIIKDLWSIND